MNSSRGEKNKSGIVYQIGNSNVYLYCIQITSPANCSIHTEIIPIRNFDKFGTKVTIKKLRKDQYTKQLMDLYNLEGIDIDDIFINPYQVMARIRLFQWCVLKSTKDFIPFCKDTSEFYLEEINLYTENAWNKKLPDSTIYFDFILFLGSMVQYDCDTRDYFAYKYKNIYPMPDQTPRGGSMDSDLADEVSNLLKAIITNRETVLKNYYQGSTEFTYGELKLQTLLELVNRSKMKFANENNFIDCGSGISNLQAGVAITQSVNSSIGVEINPLIGSAGKLYLHSFYLLARFANYSFSPTIHIIGDFNNNALDNLYNAKASIFFVNNFLLNDNTTLKLLDKISDTELSTTGIILTLNIGVGLRKFDYFANRKFEKQKFTLKDCVSWTSNFLDFFCYTRTALQGKKRKYN